MSSVVKIIHIDSEEVLFTCTLDEVEKAYRMFDEYEKMGLEVKLIVPSTPETLIDQLSVTDEEKEVYRKSLHDEIDSHNEDDDSCCYQPADLKTKKIH